MARKQRFRAAVVLLSMFMCAAFAGAQYHASLRGTVTDPQGSVIGGAVVTLTNNETQHVDTVTTDGVGAYRVGGLSPAQYTLTVERDGFKKKVLSAVVVLAEQANALDVVLEIGQATETVTVNGLVRPQLDTDSAAIGTSISTEQIQNLPTPGRDVFQLVQLAPGAFADGAQAGGGGGSSLPSNNGPGGSGASTGIFAQNNSVQVSVGGGRREMNNYQVDGVGVTSVSWGGTSIVTPNMDSVKEIEVVTNNYDAEDGRYSAGQVKITTQNGTNNLHGSFFWRAARPGLNAYQRYNGPGNAVLRNNAQLNDFGGSFGGPFLKDKLFGFFAYETIRTNGGTNSQGWYETDSYRAATPSNSASADIMGYNGAAPIAGQVLQGASDGHSCADIGLTEGVNCNTILGQGLDIGSPLTSAVGTADPTWGDSSTSPGVGAGLDGIADIQYISQNFEAPTTEQQFNGRVDYNVSAKDLVAVMGFYVPNKSFSYNGSARAMNAFDSEYKNWSMTALWDRTFSASLQNEFRANFGGWISNNLKSNPNAPFGLPSISVGNLSGYSPIGNISANGFGVGTPVIFDQGTYTGKDVVSKVLSSHQLKFGGEVSRLLFVDQSPWNARPAYAFNNMWDMLNDAPVSEAATFNSTTGVPTDFRRDTRETLYGFFAQDTYRVRPTVTLTLGLRYEYFGPMSEKYGNLAVVELGQGDEEITGVRVRKGGNLFEADKFNFGPQVGVAWSPSFGKQNLVLRGGFGLGYTGLQEANTLDGRNNPPYLSGYLQLTGDQILYGTSSFPSDPKSFYGFAANPATTATFDPTTNLPVPGQNFALAPLQAFESHLPSTQTYRYSFDAQYQVAKDWVVTAGYQGTQSRHLTRLYNYTLYDYAKFSAKGIPMAAFNGSVQNVNMYDNEGEASFNAALFSVRHRLGNAFQLEGQYRLSRGTDTGSNNYSPAQAGPCQCNSGGNSYMYYPMNLDKGPSDFDVLHTEKVFGVWQPNFFSKKGSLAEKVLGAWTLSGIMNAHTGYPWTPTDSNLGGDAVFQSSGSLYGGGAPLRPFAYAGKLKTGDFKTQYYPDGALDIFPEDVTNSGTGGPCYVAGPAMSDIVNGNASPGPIPCVPAIARNTFRGPGYFDVDATLGKTFGLPATRVIGEHAAIEIHANIYNLFNKTNLTNVDFNIPDAHFRQAEGALGSRTIDLQARFNF
jgi:hypothetical protein